MTKLDKFTLAYIECALWSSYDNSDSSGGNPLDSNYSIKDIAPETMKKIKEDCKKFQSDNLEDIQDNLEGAGHDFWLTRNCHGAGFWDGDWPTSIGIHLTNKSHAFGECDLYVGDDGKIYC